MTSPRRPKTLRDYLTRAARRVAVLWFSLALAGYTLSLLPINMQRA